MQEHRCTVTMDYRCCFLLYSCLYDFSVEVRYLRFYVSIVVVFLLALSNFVSGIKYKDGTMKSSSPVRRGGVHYQTPTNGIILILVWFEETGLRPIHNNSGGGVRWRYFAVSHPRGSLACIAMDFVPTLLVFITELVHPQLYCMDYRNL